MSLTCDEKIGLAMAIVCGAWAVVSCFLLNHWLRQEPKTDRSPLVTLPERYAHYLSNAAALEASLEEYEKGKAATQAMLDAQEPPSADFNVNFHKNFNDLFDRNAAAAEAARAALAEAKQEVVWRVDYEFYSQRRNLFDMGKFVAFLFGVLTIFVGVVSFGFSSLANWGNADSDEQKCYNKNVAILNNVFQVLIAIVTTALTFFDMLREVCVKSTPTPSTTPTPTSNI